MSNKNKFSKTYKQHLKFINKISKQATDRKVDQICIYVCICVRERTEHICIQSDTQNHILKELKTINTK